MEGPGAVGGGGESRGVAGVRYAVVVASGVIGGVFGALFKVPMSVVAPEWLFSTFPLALGALCAALLAHLSSGQRGRLLRVVLAALGVAALGAVINLSLLVATVAGALHPVWMLGPPGFLVGLAEAFAVGLVAGVTAARGGPASGRRELWAWVLSLGGVVLLLLAGFTLPAAFACSAEERGVFMEFPQYEGLRVEPTGNPEVGSCAAYYHTRASTEDVFLYFEEQLEKNGWEERPTESYRVLREGAEEVCVPADLIAEREGFRYKVSAEEIDPEAGVMPPGTGIAVHVWRLPEDQRSIPPSGPPQGCRLREPGHSRR